MKVAALFVQARQPYIARHRQSAHTHHHGTTMNVAKRIATLTAALAMTAGAAGAQIVTFSTTHTFAGTGCTAVSCTSGNYTLDFLDAVSQAYQAPTLVDLGQFSVANGGGGSTTVPGDWQFTLNVFQTTPTGGTGAFVDGISGSLFFEPSGSTLFWRPNNTSIAIGNVTYKLVTDNDGRINILSASSTQNPNTTSVKANITSVPEPSTYILMASGLVSLGVFARRRNRA